MARKIKSFIAIIAILAVAACASIDNGANFSDSSLTYDIYGQTDTGLPHSSTVPIYDSLLAHLPNEPKDKSCECPSVLTAL